MYHLFSLNQFCASFTILKLNRKTDYCSWNEEVSLPTGVSGGAQTGSGGRAQDKQEEGTHPSAAPNNTVVQQYESAKKKSCSINQKQQPKSYKLRGIVLTITLDLLAVSAFSLIKSLNVLKFPYLAATCTAVSPFYR